MQTDLKFLTINNCLLIYFQFGSIFEKYKLCKK